MRLGPRFLTRDHGSLIVFQPFPQGAHYAFVSGSQSLPWRAQSAEWVHVSSVCQRQPEALRALGTALGSRGLGTVVKGSI